MQLNETNTFSARYEVLRNNAVYAELYAMDNTVEIQNSDTSALKMSVRGTFYDYSGDINFLTDRLRAIITLNGTDYPAGTFVVTTETKHRSAGLDSVEIEGYSILYLAQRKRLEEPLYIGKGTNYITQIVRLLNLCGIENIEAEETAYTFQTAREDWEIGTAVLDIVNQLLGEISYHSVWVGLNGIVRLTKYQTPDISNIMHTYSADRYSVIEDDYEITTDRFDKCNVFRVTCENPEIDTTMVAVSENSSPDSPFSTVNIGRILHTEQVDNIPSQEALQDYADRLKYQSLQETETVEFATAAIPTHETYDVVALENGELAGIYIETGWRLPLSAGASMIHQARRVTMSV